MVVDTAVGSPRGTRPTTADDHEPDRLARPPVHGERKVRMSSVRRSGYALPALSAALVVLAGCGSSVATRETPRTAVTTQAKAVTPFCEAVANSRAATRPIAELGTGQRVEANQQVTSLAPQEMRADFERAGQLLERQLQVLEESGGDTLALSRDPELARNRTDPEYTSGTQRINDYVRRTCE